MGIQCAYGAFLHCGCRLCAVHGGIAAISLDKTTVIQRTICAMQETFVCTLYALFPCKKNWLTVQYHGEKTSLKLLYIEHIVYGYILVASRVLYMAGSLRYRWIRQP